ncbi:MAG: hypothetical protein ABI283_07040 [Rhodanobacter sp.]
MTPRPCSLIAANYSRSLVTLFTFSILLSTVTCLKPYVISMLAWWRIDLSAFGWRRLIAASALLYSLVGADRHRHGIATVGRRAGAGRATDPSLVAHQRPATQDKPTRLTRLRGRCNRPRVAGRHRDTAYFWKIFN